ncbi:MAG: inositol monophosphatase [Alphaproteobacteria bacterium]|nr:inositol monophosphatase [Alphaproteobacteria bacterium]MBE8219722.1 inositol monophosphatase [Alphaproteobacteria bacterium]
MAHLSPILSIMSEIANKASPRLRRDFGEIELLQSSEAGATAYAAKAAKRVTKQIYAELATARADYGFVFRTGEVVKGPDKTHRWLIDPIAGQTNFAHAIPHFGIAITLERTQDKITAPVASLIYNPISDELFHSENGSGGFCNNNRLRVSQKQSLTGAVIACSHSPLIETLQKADAHIRISGGDAMDYARVCAGRLDAIITPDVALWERACATIFAQESGGLITEHKGAHKNLFIMGGESVCTLIKEAISN